jgi:hypothetical protein
MRFAFHNQSNQNKRSKQVKHAGHTIQESNAYISLDAESEGITSLRTPTSMWKDSIKTYLKEAVYKAVGSI